MTRPEFNRFVKRHTKKKWRALQVLCYKCGCVLTKPGATLFAPPNKQHECERMDLCQRCWNQLVEIEFL